MEPVAPSVFEFAIAPSRDEKSEIGGDIARATPELEALGAGPNTAKEEPEAFADQLQQALIGAYLVAAPEPTAVLPFPQPDNMLATNALIAVEGDSDPGAPGLAAVPVPWVEPVSPQTRRADPGAPGLAAADSPIQPAAAQPMELTLPIHAETAESGRPPSEAPPADLELPNRPVTEKTIVLPETFESGSKQSALVVPESPTLRTSEYRQPDGTVQIPPAQHPYSVNAARPTAAAKAGPTEQASQMPAIAEPPYANNNEIGELATREIVEFEGFSQFYSRSLASNLVERETVVSPQKRFNVAYSAAEQPLLPAASGHFAQEPRIADIPPPAVEQVAKSILTRADYVQSGGGADFQLRLEPPDLGPVRVLLSARDDTIHVRLIVHETLALQQLETQVDSLRQRLEHNGISLGRFDVLQDQSGSSGSWQHMRFADAEPPNLNAGPASRRSVLHSTPVTYSRVGLVDVMA